MFIDSHTNEDNKSKVRANLLLEHIFGFCKTIKKITKGFGCELQLKTSNKNQNSIHTTLGGKDISLKINSLHLYIPSLVSSQKQQQVFNESIKSSFTLCFDLWVTD